MSLLTRLNTLLGKEEPQSTIVVPAFSPQLSFDMFGDLNTRSQVVNDCRKMFEEDARVKTALKRVAGDMLSGSFSIYIKDGPYKKKAQQVAEDVIERLDLRNGNGTAGNTLIQSMVHAMRDGDLFLQMGVNQDEGIVELSKLPLMSCDVDGYTSYSKNAYPVMFRNSNSLDKFDDPARAYLLSSMPLTSISKSDSNGIWFRQWQILHVRWDHESPRKYGIPLLSPARIAYKMLREGETDVAIRRKTRAGQKRHHKITGANPEIIEQYKTWNRDSLGNPTAAAADFFSNERTEIETLQGDEQIGVIDDIVHHLETLGVGLLVPLSMTGYGRSVNRDVLDVQNQEYRRLLEVLGEFPVASIIKPIIETQWKLNGIYPKNYDWSIEWSSRESWTLNPDGLFKLHGIVSPEYWTKLASKVLPGFDPESEGKYIKSHYNQTMDTSGIKRAPQDEPTRTNVT